MADPSGSTEAPVPSKERSPAAAEAAPQALAPAGIWERIKEHKVVQWTLAYAAAAYTLLHGTEMISEAMEWPHLIARVLTLVLALGVPVVITLAWYHGAKGLKRFSAAELTIITILLMIAGSVLWALTRTGSEHAAAPAATMTAAAHPATTSVATPAAPRTAIAVMPFANLTGDASKDYLGDGMAEELINTLAKVQGLRIPARTSTFSYKGRNTDAKQIAKDLGVGTILEGSVRSAGTTIRITAELVDAQTDSHLWSETYDRKFTDLFKLQDDLAKAIVQALQVNLNGASPALVTQAPPTQDVEAYNLYLQGHSIGLRETEQALHLALDLYGQALARDPKFARAFAARSGVRATFLLRGYPLANALEDAERDAEQALALDPSLGEAHAALGLTSAHRTNWLKAEASFRAALAADASDPEIHMLYAVDVLSATGRLHQALSEASEAYHLAPAGITETAVISLLSSYLGLDADAVKYADLAVALGMPADIAPLPQIHTSAAARGARYAEAADRMVQTLAGPIRSAGGAEVVRLVYSALADPTKKPAARQALQSLVHKLGVSNIETSSQRAFLEDFAMLDALDPAYDLANQYVDEFARSGTGGGAAWGLLWLPEMRSFRLDPRFQGFVTRLNLIDYWKQYGPPDDCDLKDGKLVCQRDE